MAAAVRTSAAGGSSTGTGDRTATITPAAGDLLVVYCCVASNTNDTPTCSDNNGGGTYDLIETMNFAIAAVNYRMSVFIRTALMVNTTSTVITVGTGSNTSGAVHVLAITGVTRTGANAVRSEGSQNNQAAATAAPTLNQAALAANPTLVAQGSADTTTTPPTNWTEIQDTNFANDTVALETAFRASGFTSTTITFGAASSTQFCSHAMELDISVLLTQSPADDINNLADARGLGYGNLHTDSVNVLADAATIVMGHVLPFSDSVNNLADGAVKLVGALLSPADSLQALTDALARLLSYELALTDSEAANWADAHQLLLAQFLALSDTNAITDAGAVALGWLAIPTDTLPAFSDTATVALSIELAFDDSLPDLTDDYSHTQGYARNFSDTLTSVAASPHGLNFRANEGFVTDGPDETFIGSDNYPTTREGLTFGYGGSAPSAQDQSTLVDVRLAGVHVQFNDSGAAIFRVDLEPGNYDITLALGTLGGARRTYFTLFDDTTPLISFTPIVTGADEFADAEGNIFSSADWPTNNVPVPVTVTSGILRFELGPVLEDFGISSIAHLGITPEAVTPSGLADSLQIGHGLVVDDGITLSDAYDQEVVSSEHKLVLSDTFVLSDVAAIGYGLFVAEILDQLADTATLHGAGLLTASDTLVLTDSESHAVGLRLDFSEAITLTDSLALGHGLATTDSLPALTDALAIGYGLAFSETTEPLTDALVLRGTGSLSFTDALTIIDAETHTLELRLAFVESITLTDSLAFGSGLSLSDVIALTDAITLNLGQQLQVADSTTTLTDTVALRLAQQLDLADTIALTDTCVIVLGYNETLSDTAASLTDAESAILGQLLSFTDTVTLTDAYAQTVAVTLNLGDSLSLTDSLALGYGLLITDDANLLTDAILTSAPQGPLRQVGVTDALEGLTESVALELGYRLAITDTISLTDAITVNEGLLSSLSDTVVITDALAATLGHLLSLADALVLNDSIQLRLGHGLAAADTIALTDSVTPNLSYYLSLADNASLLADSVVKTVGLAVIIADNGPILTDAIDLFSAGGLQFAETLALTDALTKSAAGFLPLDDSLLLTDAVAIDLRGPDLDESLADALILTDAITISLNDELRLQIVLNDTISLTDHYFDLRHPYPSSSKRHIVVSSAPRVTVVPARGATQVPSSNRVTVVPVRNATKVPASNRTTTVE